MTDERFDDEEDFPPTVAVVLGGGMHSDGSMPPWVSRRLSMAGRVWRGGGVIKVITCGRGPHPEVRTEADAMADDLIHHKLVPDEVIVRERQSRSTAENAWYVREILESLDVREAIIVTNMFHMVRSHLLFSHILGPGYELGSAVHAESDDPTDRVLAELRTCDRAQTDYLTEILLPRIEPGDRNAWHQFLFEPDSELAETWRTWRASDAAADYRAAWAKLSERMSLGHLGIGYDERRIERERMRAWDLDS